MYPYFIIAFLFRKNQEVIFSKLAAFKSIHLLLCLFCTYIILMMFFNNTSFIYLSGYTIIGKSAINQVVINFYRFIIGLVGSVLVLMIVNSILKSKVIKSRHILSSLGIYSFGIYIVSECVFVSLLPKLTKTFSPNYAITLLETLFIIIVPYFLTVLLKRFKITNRLFLGGG
jgi:peptidoglycan/LPS O-acetylase OafA/YrhL